MRMLLLDDEEFALKLLDCSVAEAVPEGERFCFRDPEKALEFAENNPVPVAFLDINMPKMNGLEVAERLMELNPEINIIFCTGYSEYAVDAFRIYSSGYLFKPIISENIADAMNHLRYPVED